jgi:4-hydroxybenzoate polyprenyltransferase
LDAVNTPAALDVPARTDERAAATSGRIAVRPLVGAMRPRQWVKNLFVFAGIIFGARAGDPVRWLEATTCFIAFCAASSAAYLVNDVRDAPFDRLHPVKRARPIARGAVSTSLALATSAVLAALAIGIGIALNPLTLGLIAAFLGLQLAYSLSLKHVVLLDVLVIAALFVIRAVAGAAAVDLPISEWLVLCTALLALFLGFAKRRGELVLNGSEKTKTRAVLDSYSLELVDQLLTIVAASTIVAYGLYALENPARGMVATMPFVLFGVFRYLLLMHRDNLGEEPERVLLRDKQLLGAVVLWAITAAIILAAS